MGSLKFDARTVDSPLVRDGLCAVSALESNPNSKEMSFVVGGVATQSYLPSRCRRPTADIDLAVLRPLTYGEFRDFSAPAQVWLRDNSYSVDTVKEHNSFQIVYSDASNHAGVIEFSRKSRGYFEKVDSRLEDEFSRSRVKIIEGKDSSCRFSSPEDIAVPKLVRCINALGRNSSLNGYFPFDENSNITDNEVEKKLNYIAHMRNQAIIHAGSLENTARLRFYSDLFDVRLLSELTGYNMTDLSNSLSNWSTFRLAHNVAADLFRKVLPNVGVKEVLDRACRMNLERGSQAPDCH